MVQKSNLMVKRSPLAKHSAQGRAECLAVSVQATQEIRVSALNLVVVGMTVTPGPVISLLVAIRLGEGHVIFGMIFPVRDVGAIFTIIPVMVVFVIAIVNPDTDALWGGVGADCHRSD